MKIDVNVPTSLSEIKLEDYQKFIKISKESKDEDDLFIRQKMVQIFCNIPLLAVLKMNRKDFMSISSTLAGVLSEKPKLKTIVDIGGEEYGFIPNIDKDLSLGEFVDLDSYMKDWDSFHKAMNVLYRPVKLKKGGRYTIKDYQGDERMANVMLSMPMDVCMGAVIFFWTLNKQLLTITPKYLQRHLAKNPQAAQALEQNGVGISTFTNSLTEACLRLEMLLPYTLAQP